MDDTFAPPRRELLRSKLSDEIEAATQILNAADVPYHVSTNSAVFDVFTMGTTTGASDMLITVAGADFERAREVMEKVYVDADLPEGHFLLSASDEEVAEILEDPAAWSAFDVAHARRLAKTRGIDSQLISLKHQERVASLRDGRIPLPWWVAIGWILALMGGVMGIICGYVIAYSKERTPDGEFYVYNESARKTGIVIMVLGLLSSISFGVTLAFYK